MDLVDRWTRLAGPRTRALGNDLVARYTQEHRRYHDQAHLIAVLDLVDELAEYADDADVVRLAAWFHDAVYDPERSDNEELSAGLAERMLADTDLAADRIAEVVRLVRLTVTHDPAPGDRNGQVLCDADLAVLAAEPEAYAAYASAVQEEYGFVPEDLFRQGRADVLRGLLGLPALFHTPRGREHFEARARHNIKTELLLLRGAAG